MSEDPILIIALMASLVSIPLLSLLLSKIHNAFFFITPLLLMVISVPMFLFVVIVPTIPISRILFYISLSVWTGSFFSLFVNLFIYGIKKATTK